MDCIFSDGSNATWFIGQADNEDEPHVSWDVDTDDPGLTLSHLRDFAPALLKVANDRKE